MLTAPNMGDSGGDSQEGDDFLRRTLPTRDICEDSARLRDFRDGLGVSWKDWGLSRVGAVVCSGEEALKPEKYDSWGDIESTD